MCCLFTVLCSQLAFTINGFLAQMASAGKLNAWSTDNTTADHHSCRNGIACIIFSIAFWLTMATFCTCHLHATAASMKLTMAVANAAMVIIVWVHCQFSCPVASIEQEAHTRKIAMLFQSSEMQPESQSFDTFAQNVCDQWNSLAKFGCWSLREWHGCKWKTAAMKWQLLLYFTSHQFQMTWIKTKQLMGCWRIFCKATQHCWGDMEVDFEIEDEACRKDKKHHEQEWKLTFLVRPNSDDSHLLVAGWFLPMLARKKLAMPTRAWSTALEDETILQKWMQNTEMKT